jgi:hypothetical protein
MLLPSVMSRAKVLGFTANASRPNNSLSAEALGAYAMLFGSAIYLVTYAFKTIATDITTRIKYKKEMQNARKT